MSRVVQIDLQEWVDNGNQNKRNQVFRLFPEQENNTPERYGGI